MAIVQLYKKLASRDADFCDGVKKRISVKLEVDLVEIYLS